jgi:hypothetical protein
VKSRVTLANNIHGWVLRADLILILSPFFSPSSGQEWVLGVDPVARLFALVPELFGDVSYC